MSTLAEALQKLRGKSETQGTPQDRDDAATRLAAAMRFRGAEKRVAICRIAAHALLSAKEREPRFNVMTDWVGALAPLKQSERDIVRRQVAKLVQ